VRPPCVRTPLLYAGTRECLIVYRSALLAGAPFDSVGLAR